MADADPILQQPNSNLCKAGNESCFSSKLPLSIPDCDVCCSEPNFCRFCSCILCGKPILVSSSSSTSSVFSSSNFVRCGDCYHTSHVHCALGAQIGGTVEKMGLDVAYYCRRCDRRTSLIVQVYEMMCACEAELSGGGGTREEIVGVMELVLRLLDGSKHFGARNWRTCIESALKKIKDGRPADEVWILEDHNAPSLTVAGEQQETEFTVPKVPQHGPPHEEDLPSSVQPPQKRNRRPLA